jgi:hypothetical protein
LRSTSSSTAGVPRRAACAEGAPPRMLRVQQPRTEPAGAAARAEELVLVPLPVTISHWMGGQSAEAATGMAGAGGLTAVAGVTAGGGAAGASSVCLRRSRREGRSSRRRRRGGRQWDLRGRQARRGSRPLLVRRSLTLRWSSLRLRPCLQTPCGSRTGRPSRRRSASLPSRSVTPSPRASVRARDAVSKAKTSPSVAHGSQTVPPGKTASAIAHTTAVAPEHAARAGRQSPPFGIARGGESEGELEAQRAADTRTRCTRTRPQHSISSRSAAEVEGEAE